MTKAATDTDTRLRVDIHLADDVLAWAEGHSGPGQPFYLVGAALEAAIARLQDEHDAVAAQCAARGQPFDARAFWRIHEEILAGSRPRRGRRPSGAATRSRVIAHVGRGLIEWASRHAEPRGPFAADNATAHAIEAGLRLLRACELPSAPRSARFPLDEKTLWKAYAAQRQAAQGSIQ